MSTRILMAEEREEPSGRSVLELITSTCCHIRFADVAVTEALEVLRAEYRTLPPAVREQAQRCLLHKHLCLLAAARGLLGPGLISPRRAAEVQHVLDQMCSFLLILDVLEPHEPDPVDAGRATPRRHQS